MNYDQPVFLYYEEKTLPSLSIKTNKNKIIEFSATIIFRLNDKSKNIENLLDSLTPFDLLQDVKIKQLIIETGRYQGKHPGYEEIIELEVSEEEYGYDKITYKIKTAL